MAKIMRSLNGYEICDDAARNAALKGFKTAGTGSAYTVSVSGISALAAGVHFIMIPHAVSASTAPTLNVNGLGAKTIKRKISGGTLTAGAAAGWLAANKPVEVVYDGTNWVTNDYALGATTVQMITWESGD